MLSVKDVAGILNVSVSTVRALIESGKLEAVNVGLGTYRVYRVSKEAFEKFCIGSVVKKPVKKKRISVEQIV